MVVSNQTTVEVTLNRPVTVALTQARTAEITELRFHADDAAVRGRDRTDREEAEREFLRRRLGSVGI